MISNSEFLKKLWAYYDKNARSLAWRNPESDSTFDPYKIMVSEIMLQQTQVARVTPKYRQFLERFPNVEALAETKLADVLRVWDGLGYNRRAKFLHQAAQKIVDEHHGTMPSKLDELIKLPGVGNNTAAAIVVYSWNKPALFIETNIRNVYIHHFFSEQQQVDDKQIIAKLTETLDQENPREFYWALMDYGAHLKAQYGNATRQSSQYAKQSTFHGSKRQVRARVIKALLAGSKNMQQLAQEIDDVRLPEVLEALLQEQLIAHSDTRGYHLG